jgi:hypothetical protein
LARSFPDRSGSGEFKYAGSFLIEVASDFVSKTVLKGLL